MEQKSLAKWLKFIIIGVGICGLIVYFAVFTSLGRSLVYDNPEFEYCYWPWLIFLWVTAIPCYAVLVLGWKIAANIGNDRSFSFDNAKYCKWISWLALGDTIYFFAGNIVLMFLNMNHPGIILMSFMVDFAGITITVVAAVLSRLIKNAAELKEQNDLTI
ncbi:MAG: DUF2975 domain-containing protein [Lachnospiraceae bacterium]|nr:DUF2975 domain-containing protein [Lachnospiraceae bacterium]